MIIRMDHIGIAVSDLEKTLKKLKKLWGIDALHIKTYRESQARIASVSVGNSILELAEPWPEDNGKISDFLNHHGEGFHHVAFEVEDLVEALNHLRKHDVRLKDKTPREGVDGTKIAFLEPEETNGMLTELVERKRNDNE